MNKFPVFNYDLNGMLHSYNDVPAGQYTNGTKVWYCHGKRHRVDGPSYIMTNGEQHWFQNGVRHRDGGPASVWPDGTYEWVVHGVPLNADALIKAFKDPESPTEEELIIFKLTY